MRINQLDLLFWAKEKIGKFMAVAALIILLPVLSYAGITDKIADDFKTAATSTYKTLGGYSAALSGYADSAYQKANSFSVSVSDSLNGATGRLTGAVDYLSTTGTQYLNKLSAVSIQDTIRNNNTYQAITSSFSDLSSPSSQQSPSITEHLSSLWGNFKQKTSDYLQTNVLSPLSGAYSVAVNTLFPPPAGGAVNNPIGNNSVANTNASISPGNANAMFIRDRTNGENWVKRKTDKNDSSRMVIVEHKRPGRQFNLWPNSQNILPVNFRPRPGKGLGGMNKIQQNLANNNADFKEIQGAFDLFEKEVGGYLVDNSSVSTNPQTTPYCKDCHQASKENTPASSGVTAGNSRFLMAQPVNSSSAVNNSTQSLNQVFSILGIDTLAVSTNSSGGHSVSKEQQAGYKPSAIIGMKKEVSTQTNTTSAVNANGLLQSNPLQTQSSGVNSTSSGQIYSGAPACKDCHGSNVPFSAGSIQKEGVKEQAKTYSLSTQRVETQIQIVNNSEINPASLNDPAGPYRNDGKRVSDQSISNPKYNVSENSGNTTNPILQRYQPTAQDQQVRRSAVMKDNNGTAYYQQFNGTSSQTVSLNKPYNDYANEALANTTNNATKSVTLFNGQTYDVSKVVFSSKANSYDERASGVVTTSNTFIPAYMIDKGKTDSGEYTFALPRNIAAYTNASQQTKEVSSSVNTQVQPSTITNVVSQQTPTAVINPAVTTTVTQSTAVKPASLINMYQPTAQDQQVRRSAVMKDNNGTAYYQQFNGTSSQTVSLNKPYNDYANEALANTTNNATKSVTLFNGQTYDVSKVVFSSKANSYDERTSGVVTTSNTFIPAYMINKGITASGEYTFALPKNIAEFQKDNNNNF